MSHLSQTLTLQLIEYPFSHKMLHLTAQKLGLQQQFSLQFLDKEHSRPTAIDWREGCKIFVQLSMLYQHKDVRSKVPADPYWKKKCGVQGHGQHKTSTILELLVLKLQSTDLRAIFTGHFLDTHSTLLHFVSPRNFTQNKIFQPPTACPRPCSNFRRFVLESQRYRLLRAREPTLR